MPKQLIYRVIDLEGNTVAKVPEIDKKTVNKIYRQMIYTEEMDTVLLQAKGQGRVRVMQERYRST